MIERKLKQYAADTLRYINSKEEINEAGWFVQVLEDAMTLMGKTGLVPDVEDSIEQARQVGVLRQNVREMLGKSIITTQVGIGDQKMMRMMTGVQIQEGATVLFQERESNDPIQGLNERELLTIKALKSTDGNEDDRRDGKNDRWISIQIKDSGNNGGIPALGELNTRRTPIGVENGVDGRAQYLTVRIAKTAEHIYLLAS